MLHIALRHPQRLRDLRLLLGDLDVNLFNLRWAIDDRRIGARRRSEGTQRAEGREDGPHRRLPWTPGFSSLKPSPHLVVIVDVSGSIDDALLERFAREIEAIARRQDAELVLIVGDDEVRRVQEFAPGRSALRDIQFGGGGGADFTPMLREADEHTPDVVVVLTDLDGPAHYRPRCPVIWAVPPICAAAVPPFGRKLTMRSRRLQAAMVA